MRPWLGLAWGEEGGGGVERGILGQPRRSCSEKSAHVLLCDGGLGGQKLRVDSTTVDDVSPMDLLPGPCTWFRV